MKTWALARFTFKDTIRTKTMVAGLAISLLYLAFVPMLSSAGSGGMMISDDIETKAAAGRDFLSFALNGLNFIGMFMAVFTTLGTIHSEVERGTILTLITKPVSRRQVILGKWLGHVMLMSAYVLIMGMALWLSVAVGSQTFVWPFFVSLLLVCLNVITIISITFFFSTFLPVVANAIFVFLIMVITSNMRVVNAVGETSQSFIISAAATIFRMVLPVGEVGDLSRLVLLGKARAAELAVSEAGSFSPRGWSFAYEIVYFLGMVLLASYIFGRKDLKQT